MQKETKLTKIRAVLINDFVFLLFLFSIEDAIFVIRVELNPNFIKLIQLDMEYKVINKP